MRRMRSWGPPASTSPPETAQQWTTAAGTHFRHAFDAGEGDCQSARDQIVHIIPKEHRAEALLAHVATSVGGGLDDVTSGFGDHAHTQ